VEKLGIPTVPVVTVRFEELAKASAYKKGMPLQRFTFVPHPVALQPVSVHKKYIEGHDPVTGQPVMEEIIQALTKPLTETEKKTGAMKRVEPRLVAPDTPDNLQQIFLKNGWTDGFPIILPTEKKVAEMLRGTSQSPQKVVGKMRPSPPHEDWEYTVEAVAVNAVMAGAKPEYFPVILAIASTGITSLFSSTTSFARMVVVNGPIGDEIGMNSGLGAMGPFNHANATIGRAWTLLSRNLGGGAVPGETYLGSQGNNLNYNNLCIAENEARSPWEPFHVQKGFKAKESVVSIFRGWSILHSFGASKKEFQNQIASMLGSFCPYSSDSSSAGALVLVDPLVAKDLKEKQGFDTKQKLSEFLHKNTLITVEDFWNSGLVGSFTLPQAQKGMEPFASWLKLPKDALIPRFLTPKEINVIVVGGETYPFWQSGDFRFEQSVSVDAWKRR
jgi:hypothetical protein